MDSIDAESWYNFAVAPAQRNARHEQYDRYIVDEVVPFVRSHCNQPETRPMTNGCSMGAYHAVNFFFKHPDLFQGTIACSGLYRLDRSEFGLSPDDMQAVYYNSPLNYLSGLGESWYLDYYRQRTIVVAAGQGAWDEEALEDTRRLEAICRDKSIPVWTDIWGPRCQPRLALVVQTDESFSGAAFRLKRPNFSHLFTASKTLINQEKKPQ